jgi:hypothetical protein
MLCIFASFPRHGLLEARLGPPVLATLTKLDGTVCGSKFKVPAVSKRNPKRTKCRPLGLYGAFKRTLFVEQDGAIVDLESTSIMR